MIKNHPLTDGNKRCGSFLFFGTCAATPRCWQSSLRR
ncbi:hypothetical protein ACUN7Z_02420 [Vreelandella venusta]